MYTQVCAQQLTVTPLDPGDLWGGFAQMQGVLIRRHAIVYMQVSYS